MRKILLAATLSMLARGRSLGRIVLYVLRHFRRVSLVQHAVSVNARHVAPGLTTPVGCQHRVADCGPWPAHTPSLA
jgi:hypothetical protein